ncbi:NCS1 family nucleobase:cation symporter-1 [Kineosphaera limosa]|uniref:Putative permease n=1 Tax=Kineosphaera limosa NBRC 100340 TaxID=1184609 RepID=K6XCW8_9MICO|nr:NCS1 family transporter [Kineosphaera limosa]NYD99957.1 NCS1 family nucleobase:cation symporter-1 [Kineosphaera limosa]GAB96659.1 putative permease [Kineosphaera limosa NBRC 100340]
MTLSSSGNNHVTNPSGVDVVTDKGVGQESLAPQQKRIMGKVSYLLAWLGGCVSIGTFTMGSSLVGTLNLTQSVVAMAIGCFIIGVGLAVNGAAGYRYGIPFMVQARSAFGFSGTRIPGFIRAVPALVWFGFQSWIGAAALNQVSATLFGFDNLVAFFIGFQLLQILLSIFGFHGIKWLENIGAAFILVALVYMFFSVINRYGAQIQESLVATDGTWGLPFWNATMLFLGIYATMMLNVSDYSREHAHGTSPGLLVTIYAMSILPVTVFMGLIGLMVSSATGVVDPIQVFANAVDNTLLMVVTLLFIAFAQVTTNVLNNVVPPTYVLMDVFKMPFRAAAVVVGFLAFATFPWLLVRDESAAGLQVFVQTYSAFLGPIFAVLVTDYYIVRRRQLDLTALYDADGPYRGVNPAALIATVVGVAVAFAIPAIGWYASLLPAGLTYWLLMRHWPACRRFLPAGDAVAAGNAVGHGDRDSVA